LWIATFNGLARFDGVTFKVFEPDETPELLSSRIVALSEDPQGALWVATEEGDLVRESRNAFVSHRAPDRGVITRSARSLAHTADGAVWMMTMDNQLMKFANGNFSIISTNWNLQDNRVNGMATDKDGELWIGTDKELAVWRQGGFEVAWDQSHEQGFSVVGLARSRAGGCWVVGNGRLRRFASGKWDEDAGPYVATRAIVDGLCEARSGDIWLGTYGNGLFCYQTNGVVLHMSTRQGLPSDVIRCLYADREDNIWVGTEGGGLVRLKPKVFQSFGRQEGLSGDCALSVCEGADGEIWVGTNGGGVDRLKDGRVQAFHGEQGLTNEFVWSVHQDRNHVLWAGTWGGGLFRLDGDKFTSVGCEGQGPEPVVCSLFEDSHGTVWLGQQRSRAEVLGLKEGKTSVVRLPSQLPRTDVRVVTEDKRGNLWIGTYDDGLYLLRGSRAIRFGKHEGMNSERIRSLYVDDDGVLWIGTYKGGLNRLEENRFRAITSHDGLLDDVILHIEEDRRGNLWFSSAAGVFRAGKDELNRFARGQSSTVHCLAYTKADGLPGLECTGGSQPSGCKSRDGRLWFPTVNGVAVVDPDKVPFNPLPPPVWIEKVISEGKKSSSVFQITNSVKGEIVDAEPGEIELPPLSIPPGKPRCEFHYTALSLTAPEKVRFRHKLEGSGEDWTESGSRVALYNYLPPGTYRFRVQACNNDDVWNEVGASLAIIMLPQFWQTWWFRTLLVAAVLLIFVGAYELRLASERRLTGLRLRIARDLHDEVGSNLGSIALISEVMPKTSAPATDEVSEIRRIAVQTIESLRDIVWFLDPTNDNMDDLVLRMKDTARTMLPGIPFEFRCTGSSGTVKPSLGLRRNLFPILKEILHNVAKHAHATKVDIELEISPREIQLRVNDNGVGFDEPRVKLGNGLKNLRRRAAELAGALKLGSHPGKGTTVILTAPIT
jgi:ligand-binding sensor domain-containing protein